MEIKRRSINHSKRWSKIRRQLPGETVSTPPPPAATSLPPEGNNSGLESEDDSEESEDDSDEGEGVEDIPPSGALAQESTQTSTLLSLAPEQSAVQATSSSTGILETPITVSTSVTPITVATSVTPITVATSVTPITVATSVTPITVATSVTPITVATSVATTLETAVIPTSFKPTDTASAVPAAGVLSEESSSSLSAMNIAAISLGSIMGAVCIAAAFYFVFKFGCRSRRRNQHSQTKDPYGDVDQVRIVDDPSPPPVARVQFAHPEYMDQQRFSFHSLSSTADNESQIPSYSQAVAYDLSLHPTITRNDASQDETPSEQVDPSIDSARTSRCTNFEGFILEPRRQPPYGSLQARAPPQFSPPLQQAHVTSPSPERTPAQVPVSLPAPELAHTHIHTPFPAQSHPFTAQIIASPPTISTIRHGPRPDTQPSTFRPMPSVFVSQNRESITPSESTDNAPYDRAGARREIEKLQAMVARRTAATGGIGHRGVGRYANGQRWI